MSTTTLYRKYRSKDFSEIIGQDHITVVLDRSIKKSKVSHAYLFTGPRGVGKTSVARIFARNVNKLKPEQTNHIDIIEIDAASNRRIDEIRELREKVHVSPIELKYKVYIIDEVHMLTKEAFNALLKTLEEPPEHCIFILATTEAHKLPDTIVSRTQRHNFQLINSKLIYEHLNKIAKKEQINITKEALELIAEFSGGSFRDAISLLDQFSGHEQEVDVKTAATTLGLADKQLIDSILESVDKNQKDKLLSTIDKALASGINAQNLANQLVRTLLNSARENQVNHQKLKLCDELLEVAQSTHPEVKLEIALLRTLSTNPPENNESFNLMVKNKPKNEAEDKKIPQEKHSIRKSKVASEDIESVNNAVTLENELISDDLKNQILNNIKATNSALYGVMRLANFKKHNESVIVEFKFAFHGRRASDKKNKTTITDAVKKVIKDVSKVEVSVNAHLEETKPKTDMVNDPAKGIIDTFGGGEIINYG